MKLLIGSGVGLVFGVLCLLQVVGLLSWMPIQLFTALHTPAMFLAGLVVHGERGWNLIPYTVVVQWVLLGAVVGGVFQLLARSKGSL